MPRAYVSEDIHKRVKKFAADSGKTVQDSYQYIIESVLDEEGNLAETVAFQENPDIIAIELTEGKKELIKDIAREEGVSEREVVEKMFNMGVNISTTEDYHMIDWINEQIGELQEQISNLEEMKERLKGD